MYILDLVLKLGCNGGSRAWTSEGWLKGRISRQIRQNGLSVYSDKMKHIPIIYIKIGIEWAISHLSNLEFMKCEVLARNSNSLIYSVSFHYLQESVQNQKAIKN